MRFAMSRPVSPYPIRFPAKTIVEVNDDVAMRDELARAG
jgi:hypothetical protein